MNVGIIGLGSIGGRHQQTAVSLGHTVVAYDAPQGIGTLADIVACDAVLVCTPAGTHLHLARELRDSGYAGPLFVEKPLAYAQVAECDVFRDWPHPTTMVGYQLRFHAGAQALKAGCPEATFGTFTAAADMRLWPGRGYAPPLYELSHELDLAIWCGAPVQVTAPSAVTSDRVVCTVGEWVVTLDARPRVSYRREWMLSSQDRCLQQSYYTPAALGEQMYRDELAHFLDCARRGVPTVTPFADGLRVLEVCEQVMASLVMS